MPAETSKKITIEDNPGGRPPARLSYFPLSTYSQKVLIALHEKGAAFESEQVRLFDETERERYRNIYSLGRIPLSVLDDGHLIPESSIIVEYLDATLLGGTRLIRAEPDDARQTRFHDRMPNLYLNDSIASLLFKSWKPEVSRDRKLIKRSRSRAGVVYDFLEHRLDGRAWLMGEEFTMADCAAATALLYVEDNFPFAERPAIAAYSERLNVRPSYARVLEETEPYLRELRDRAA